MTSQFVLHNRYISYPEASPRPLPQLSELALQGRWIYVILPVLWAALALLLLIRLHRTGISQTHQHIHTSGTLLVGLFMLGFFVLAGIMPFISLMTGISQ
jgi:hypothetical protein